MPPRELTSVAHHPSGALQSLPLESSNHKEKGKKRSTKRGSHSWYCELVDYFYHKREEYESFWQAVDHKLRETKWENANHDKEGIDYISNGAANSEVEITVATVMSQRPEIHLKGWTGDITSNMAPIAQIALNNEWWTMPRLVRETRLGVRDSKKYGMGVAMTTYDQVKEESPDETEGAVARASLQPGSAAQADMVRAEAALEEAQQGPEDPDETFEGDSRVIFNQINTRHVPLWDFLIDPDANNPEDARWIGRRIIADLEMVKADPSLKNTDRLTATEWSTVDAKNHKREHEHKSPYKFIELFEVWERQPKGRWNKCLFAKSGKGFLKEPTEDPNWMGHPFSVLRWNEDGVTIFPQSDLMPQWSLMLAEELLTNKALDGHLREQYDLTLVPRGLIDEESFQGIMGNGEVGYWAEYNETGRPDEDIRRKIYRPEVKPRSPETLNFAAMLERTRQKVSGFGNNQFGAANKSDTTATEAAEIAGFARARGSHKFAATEEFVADIAHKRLALMAQWYSKEDMIRLVGDQGAQWPEGEFTRGDIRQGVRVIVMPGSMKPVNDEVRASYLMQMLQAFAQHPALLARLDLNEWATRFARTQGVQDGDTLVSQLSQEDHARLIAQLQAQQGGGGQASPPGVSAPAASSSGVSQNAQGPAGAAGGGR